LRRPGLASLLIAALAAGCGAFGGDHGVVRNDVSGLETWEVGSGSRAMVLLHGYGSSPQEWLPFTSTIVAAADRRFVFPQGPDLTQPPDGPSGGRAWWRLDLASYRTGAGAVPDLSTARPRELEPIAARVRTLVGEVESRTGAAPGSTILAGHSQGGMIAGEVAFRSTQPMLALVLISGTIVDEASWVPGMPSRRGLPVFIAHGRRDDILSFDTAERLAGHLRRSGLRVTWVPHDDGHETPVRVVTALNAFLADVDRKP